MEPGDPSVPVVVNVEIAAIEDRGLVGGRLLTDEEFHRLRDVPAVLEWLKNIPNERTRVAYGRDVAEFVRFVGIQHPDEFRLITSAHVIAFRDSLQDEARLPKPCSDSTVRRKLSALSSLFDFLCERHAVAANVVLSVTRPKSYAGEGSTPAISDEHMRELLKAPAADTLKGIRDRAILATLGYHGLRESELCGLLVEDYTRRDGVMQFKVHGKGGKIRYVPVHPVTQQLIAEYLEAAGHGGELEGALFRPVKNNRTRAGVEKALSPTAVYSNIVLHYAKQIGITLDTHGFCVHSMRVTFGTNAWEHGADIVAIQKTLGHANISTTRGYLRQRKESLERSPSFKVKY